METPIKIGDKVKLFGLTLIVRQTIVPTHDCQECCVHHICARRDHLDNMPSHFTTLKDLCERYNVIGCAGLIGFGTNFGPISV